MRAWLLVLLLGCAAPEPRIEIPMPEPADAGCTFWVCRGCEREPYYDFACRGREFLTQAYRCPDEWDLCKASDYTADGETVWCCFPAPGQP